MTEDTHHGRFMWFDLMTSDPDGAMDFYTKLVGWGTQPWQGGDVPYTMWANRGRPLGGVADLPEEVEAAGAPPHWMSYVAVSDVDAAVARTGELGGTVLRPATDIPGAGRYAVIQDPQGASVAVYRSSSNDTAPTEPPGVGEFSWHELATSDHGAAFHFYSELFGWEKQEAMDMGNGWIYQIYGRGERPFGGMFTKTEEMPGPPCWVYYIRVDDIDQSVEKVKELGGQVLNGPTEVPGGDRVAQCSDPQGAVFALHSSGRTPT